MGARTSLVIRKELSQCMAWKSPDPGEYCLVQYPSVAAQVPEGFQHPSLLLYAPQLGRATFASASETLHCRNDKAGVMQTNALYEKQLLSRTDLCENN